MGFFKNLIDQYKFDPAQQSGGVPVDEITLEDAVVELQDRVRNLESAVADLLRQLDEDTDSSVPTGM